MIYLDNAATTYPKPEAVYVAMDDFMRRHAGNPGRSGHRLALAAQGAVEDARREVAGLINAPDPDRIAFMLNCTDAINTALKGLLRPGDEVVTSSMEHNAVVRPLHRLAQEGVRVTYVPCDATGRLDPDDVARALTARTRLVVLSHASNVCGAIQPIAEIATLVRAAGPLLMLDGAQSLGALPLDVQALPVDLVAFPGHKGLLGPMGTGGLYVGERAEVRSLREGGTGSASESPEQPHALPFRLEAGTANAVGLAGLAAGVRFVRATGVDAIHAHEMARAEQLRQAIGEIPGLRLQGPAAPSLRTAIVSFTLDGWEPADVGAILDGSFDIAVRPGLHCAPLAHQTLGTAPLGTVRLSCGFATTEADVLAAAEAVRRIAAG